MKPNGTVHLSDIPELAREWDFEKNISDLTPDKITVGSNRIVWWRCAKGHSWKDAVVKRTHGKPCPYCTNRRVLIGYNDLATLYPKLANEWDYSNSCARMHKESFVEMFVLRAHLGGLYPKSNKKRNRMSDLCKESSC